MSGFCKYGDERSGFTKCVKCLHWFKSYYLPRKIPLTWFLVPPLCKWDLRSSGSYSVYTGRRFETTSRSHLRGYSSSRRLSFFSNCLALDKGNRLIVPKRRRRTTNLRCVTSQKSDDIKILLHGVSVSVTPRYVSNDQEERTISSSETSLLFV